MSLLPEWEGPYYKLLSTNDSGEARGKQSGVVLPAEFDKHMPDLSGISGNAPGIQIRAILVLNGNVVDQVQTRYQYQTWGGTRSPERRITGNLGRLLANTQGNDIFLIERNVADETIFRLSVITSDDIAYGPLVLGFGEKRWGLLSGATPFVSRSEIEEQAAEIEVAAATPFAAFEGAGKLVTSRRIARSRAFRKEIVRQYPVCAICGGALRSPSGSTEIEAAHIISRGASGTDDPRNGIGLCRVHHWAFDEGLLSIADDRSVVVSPKNILPSNASLGSFESTPLRPPLDGRFAPHIEATRWHLHHVFVR